MPAKGDGETNLRKQFFIAPTGMSATDRSVDQKNEFQKDFSTEKERASPFAIEYNILVSP